MYISTYTYRRSREPARGDIIEDIDTIRNGLLLFNGAHRLLGKELAFLRTPNFAMETTDVDPTAPPTEQRYTTHIFDDHPYPPFQLSPSLKLIGTPDDPPSIIFEAVYAGSVLQHFGTSVLKNDLSETWKDTYPGNVVNVQLAQREQNQDQLCDTRHQAHEPDTLDMLMTLPYILVPKDELQVMLREAKEKAEAAEWREVQDFHPRNDDG
ncbi:hypothetical protein GALMADRAFT_206130 [Galerina marginata CBS 339.88]|uniref:HNH nuclease domain-containing protein n=1 Tax=Galerina marginata (strain CBS 339.88) TaxID=685588 RepID=A0A067TN33_GALM3|nr:hypothetical protein GALMADRAFT_206130 [Galerina marginata CBS 339.88]